MARPNKSDARREELLPEVARVFAERGYARATTAELAERCGLRENQLYRLWPSKKAMFLAAIEHLYDQNTQWWTSLLQTGDPSCAFKRLLEEEGRHRGESGLHRIIFAGLSEVDDSEIREALASLYKRFHRFISTVLKEQAAHSGESAPNPALAAWSLIALGTLTNVARDLDLFPSSTQRKLINEVGGQLAGID